jgi:hypothetical protein
LFVPIGGWALTDNRRQLQSMLLEVSVQNETHNYTKRRVLQDASLFEVVDVVCSLLPLRDVAGHDSCRVCVRETHSLFPRKELGFTNICGKVVHHLAWHHRTVHVPAVWGWLVHEHNSFGPSVKLSSPNSTLMTCMDSSVTRFCGGVSFEKTLEVLEIAIDQESVSSVTLHMLVANEHIGRPVQTSSSQLLSAFAADGRWTTNTMHEHEDVCFVAGFLLSAFDAATLERQAGFALAFCPLTVRVMVSRRGKVNYFVTLDSVPMARHAELQHSVFYLLGEIRKVLLLAT